MSCLAFGPYFLLNAAALSDIYTLSLHDALPICNRGALINEAYECERKERLYKSRQQRRESAMGDSRLCCLLLYRRDRKSTRLNSSHVANSYAVFCLKKKTSQPQTNQQPSTPPQP